MYHIRILFSEKYVHIIRYSVLAYAYAWTLCATLDTRMPWRHRWSWSRCCH